jgi:hypothetical protein
MPTYNQNQATDLLPKGIYPFYVKNATETTSLNGNEKIELILEVNGCMTVYDNLTFVANSFWKIDQFRIATGEKLGTAGSEVSFEADDCIQRKGFVEIDVNEYKGRIRNIVVGYMDPADQRIEQTKAAPGPVAPVPGVKKAEPTNIPY